MAIRSRFSKMANRVRSWKHKTKLNKVRLNSKINDIEPKNMNSRRRKRINRIILLTTLTVVIGSICYYNVPLKAKLLTVWAKLVKTKSTEPTIDSTIQPKNRSQYCKFALLGIAVIGVGLISDRSNLGTDKSEIAVTSSFWKKGPLYPEPSYVLIVAICEFIALFGSYGHFANWLADFFLEA